MFLAFTVVSAKVSLKPFLERIMKISSSYQLGSSEARTALGTPVPDSNLAVPGVFYCTILLNSSNFSKAKTLYVNRYGIGRLSHLLANSQSKRTSITLFRASHSFHVFGGYQFFHSTFSPLNFDDVSIDSFQCDIHPQEPEDFA